MATIDDLLDDSEKGESAAPPAAEVTADETLQDSPEALPEKTVPLKALEDERQKRQSYEQQLADLQRQQAALVEMLQRQAPAPPAPPAKVPDFLTENDQWQQYLFQSIGQLLQQRDQQAWLEKVQASEEEMRDEHDDYDVLVDQFFKPAVQRDPTLSQKLRGASNPAKFAYRQAKRLQTEAELGGDLDLAKIEARVEAKVRAKVLAELEGKQEELKGKVKLPVSLGTEGNSGALAGAKIPPGGYRIRDLLD